MPYSQPYLLTGRSTAAFSRSSGPLALAVLIFLLLLCGGSYLAYSRFFRAGPTKQEPTQVAAPSPKLSDPAIDDLTLHMQNANTHLQQSIELVRRAQQRTSSVLDALGRNYLFLERRRLESSRQLSENAIWQATQALEELQVARQQLKSQGGKNP